MDDSVEMARVFAGLGFEETDDPREARVIHINTCAVRKKAEDKFFSFLGEQKQRRLKGEKIVIGVSGCVPELHDLSRTNPEIDYITGAGRPDEYLDIIKRAVASSASNAGPVSAPDRGTGLFEFQTVIRGCSNYCAYCVVPYARGAERSIPVDVITEEIRRKVSRGVKEITLLGQNVLAYGGDLEPRVGLIDVIRAAHEIDGLVWIRFVTSHPRWVTADFVRGVARLPKVCEYFHVPFQSGDDEVLSRMNRGYTVREYVEKMEMIRDEIPGAAISADAIVGFPGESEEQFENTLRLVEAVAPDQLYAFKYSVRPGTRAAGWEDDVPKETKERRLAALGDLHKEIARKINGKIIGSIVDVMVSEKVGDGRFRGRTRTNKITDFRTAADHKIGEVIRVGITGATPHALQGESE